MDKYRIRFEFLNALGEWISDYLDNNGKGFCEEDALYIAQDFRSRGHRNVKAEMLPEWRTYETGDKVTYEYDDFDGHGTLNCYISSIHADHAIAMDYDAVRYWIDDDTQQHFRKGWA